VLFAIPAGVIADRMSRRGVMASAEALRVASLIAIVALAELGCLTWPVLAALGFIGACGTVAYSVTTPSLVPSLVPPQALAAANARVELARTAAFAAGPALAGALISWIGDTPAFGFAATLSACAVILLSGVQEPPRPVSPARHPIRDVREGARFMLRHPLLRPIFLTQFVFNTALFILQAVYVPYAVDKLGLSAFAVGLTLATYGVGMIIGALMASRVICWLRLGTVIAIGPIAGFIASVVMVLTICAPSSLLAALSFVLLGVGPILWVISTTTLRQLVTPRNLLGRVSALNIAAYGARPIGAAIGAFVGEFYGAETCLVVASAGFLIQATIILTSPVIRVAQQPEIVE
jgi:predicted MFS family arabinose efflux permease